jgi:hypothetical protein
VQITRPYTIENAAGLTFDLVSPDLQGGGTLRSRCQVSYDGLQLVFHAETEPWLGTGTLAREGP